MKEKKHIPSSAEPIVWTSPFTVLKNMGPPLAPEVRPRVAPTRRATHRTEEEPWAGGSHSSDCTSRRQDRNGRQGFRWHRSGRTRDTRQGDAESLWCRGYGEGRTDRNSGRPARGSRPHSDQRRFSSGVCWRVTGLARIFHDGSSRNGGVARDKREERDSRDV